MGRTKERVTATSAVAKGSPNHCSEAEIFFVIWLIDVFNVLPSSDLRAPWNLDAKARFLSNGDGRVKSGRLGMYGTP